MRPTPLALTPLALALLAVAAGPLLPPAQAQGLEPSRELRALPRDAAARTLPIILRADRLTSRPDAETVAEGAVEFRRGGLVLRADRLSYDAPTDTASARGHVRVARDGAVYVGPELTMALDRVEGLFLEPGFEFLSLGAGGRADRLEFLGPGRTRAVNAWYTSCPREPVADGREPDWVLRTRRIELDLAANEGIAEGAELRFLGVPILALPTLSFPLGDARKSGWLPPSVDIDNRSGVVISAPYYWNIAPNRDATLAPRLLSRRGLGLDAEFRYLEPGFEGAVRLDWLPDDQQLRRSREGLQWQHEGTLPAGLRYGANLVRVSDDDWWKDFPDAGRSFTARLLPARLHVERPFDWAGGEGLLYVRSLQWQVLQEESSFITAPYERSPQIGASLQTRLPAGLQAQAELEFNRFTLPDGQAARLARPLGDRLHLLGALSRPVREPGWWIVPRVAFNAAAYDNARDAARLGPEGLLREARVIPTYSVDAGLELERRTTAFGRELHQTLEPRLQYVHTPYREQARYPNYDSAARDFNIVSLFSENAFTGVDRVSDAHQVTAGFTTRLVDAASGAEALRLGLVQRYLLRPQRITPRPDGSPDGEPLTQRFSDALLVGSTSVLPGWNLEAAVQYSPDIQRSVRSVVSARYSPGPFRTVSATYRLARGLSEQLEVGWQWPLAGVVPGAASGPRDAGNGCRGAWYGAGRFNYSLKDRRLTDSVLGLEYDAGCWIARVVATQLSTGRSEATTRIGFQLELTGLSRLNVGSNPLRLLKDNIPGYQLLREERGRTPADDRQVPTFHD